ncbi:hypothetical protein KN815_01905 [Streptomyces sp. 4503]|uniref:Uncharacterized protein n=1 Tax=Streptomyces niphimycinicus TaxID=2842201 RepID=A0ABS6C7P6_9ACTN|nr:hypothetical protein [Streptomyces niphimycinicus]MBU3862903.1 hypothetical protein [Streptomyces niphimycinicus]
MDQNVLALAGAAGTTIVTLMVTDAWEQARRGVVSLWQRFRPQEAEEIDGLLSRSREALLTGGEQADIESEWQLRLGALLAQRQEATAALSSLLSELNSDRNGQVISGTMHLEAHVGGQGQVYQSARDQTVNHYR